MNPLPCEIVRRNGSTLLKPEQVILYHITDGKYILIHEDQSIDAVPFRDVEIRSRLVFKLQHVSPLAIPGTMPQ